MTGKVLNTYGDTYYLNQMAPGDGTVPKFSAYPDGSPGSDPNIDFSNVTNIVSQEQFPSLTPVLSSDLDHTGMFHVPSVESKVLADLGTAISDENISTSLVFGNWSFGLTALIRAKLTTIVWDPIQGFLVDANGKRLGYSAATGVLTEIPGSQYYGGEDGFAIINGPVALPLHEELIGDGGSYYISVEGTDGDLTTSVQSSGFLAAGQQATNGVPFESDPFQADHLTISAPLQAVAGGKFTVTVEATDPDGFTYAPYSGTVALSLSGARIGGKLGGVLIAPVVNGVATFSNLSFNQAGSYTLFAASTSDLRGASATITVSTTTHFSISAPPSATAGQSFNLTVRALNASGQVDTNYQGTVHFTSIDLNAGLPADYTFTGGDAGVHVFSGVTLNTGGSRTITGADSTLATAKGTSGVVKVLAGTLQDLTITSFPTPVVAGVAHSFTVTAVDAFGNKVGSYRGTVHFSSNDPGSPALPGDYSFTATDAGAHVFSATLKTPGGRSLTATDTLASALAATAGPINVASTATHLIVTGVPASHMAGQAFAITVTALDASGHTDTNFGETVQFTSTDLKAGLPANYMFTTADHGVHTFNVTLTTALKQTITVTDTTRPTIKLTSTACSVTAAAPSMLSVTGYPAADVSGATHSVTVTAVDAFGNRITSYGGTVQFSSTDTAAGLPTAYLFKPTDAGTHKFNVTLKSLGSQSITASDGTNSGTQAGIALAAATTHLSISGMRASTTAGASFNITVTALTATGQTDTLFPDTIHFSSSDPNAILPSDTTLAAGTGSFPITFTNTGSGTITVTDLNRPTLKVISTASAVKSTAAAPTAHVSGPTVGVPGQPLTLTLSETGQPLSTVFTYKITWGDGTSQSTAGVSGLTVTHAYPAIGTFNVKVTPIGTAGIAGTPATLSGISVQSATMEGSDLYIGGTTGNDTITITPAVDTSGQTVSVKVNSAAAATFPLTPTARIFVYGQAGTDKIQEVTSVINGTTVHVAIPAILFAGSGNTVLSAAGSSANNVFVGGIGNDSLTGGSGRDILIGGGGMDTLRAGTGDDILIGDSTVYDANQAALLALAAEWNRTNIGYQPRVQDLFGDGPGGLNGTFLLNQSVHRDTAIDQIFGGPGQDWFWSSASLTTASKITNFVDDEVATLTSDTVNPNVVSLTPSVATIANAQVGATFALAVQYSNTMNPAVAPTLTLSPSVSSTLSFASGSWNADRTVYTAIYNVANGGMNVNAVAVGVSGGLSSAGNLQVPFLTTAAFASDTVNPTVASLTPSVASITNAQVGSATFALAVQYSDTMNIAVAPILTFSPSVSSTLTFASGSWSTDGTLYTAVYNVANSGATIGPVAVDVSGGLSSAGNTQIPFSNSAAFAISMVANTLDVSVTSTNSSASVNASYFGESFVPTVSGALTQLNVLYVTALYNSQAQSLSSTSAALEIYQGGINSSNDTPAGPLLYSQAFTFAVGESTVTFTTAPQLTAGQTYLWRVVANGVVTIWVNFSTNNPYTQGDDLGAPGSGYDLSFQTYMG